MPPDDGLWFDDEDGVEQPAEGAGQRAHEPAVKTSEVRPGGAPAEDDHLLA